MAEQPDGHPDHPDPDLPDCGQPASEHRQSDPADADYAPPCTAAQEENPRGRLFISDVQALRRADTVSLSASLAGQPFSSGRPASFGQLSASSSTLSLSESFAGQP